MGYPRIWLLCRVICVFIICDIVYLSDSALECVLQELLKAIHTGVIFASY